MLQIPLSVLFQPSSQCENKEDQIILNIKNYMTNSRSDRNEGFRTKVPAFRLSQIGLIYRMSLSHDHIVNISGT